MLEPMIKFSCDYMEVAHPAILKRLQEIALEKNDGYGLDDYSRSAATKIRRACHASDDTEVHFLVGGTQTNAVVLAALLMPWEGVLAAAGGHINVHEAGAIEAGGHKVMTAPSRDGKVDAAALGTLLRDMQQERDTVGHEHYVEPRVLYISQSTETGTVYSLAELEALRRVCDEWGLWLYMDGARMAYALAASDVTLPDVARLCHVFYIGGTKCGAMMGEAVVVPCRRLTINRGLIKRSGAMLAKGWLLGVQFDVLFTGRLYEQLGRNAVEQAMRLRQGLIAKGYRMMGASPTNQQFVVMENARLAALSRSVQADVIAPADDAHTIVRFATSWATTARQVDELLAFL